MNPQSDTIGQTGLQFFGTMTASISHEIKNVLAIINENAGLMKDLALLAEQGRPLNLEKIISLADRFGQQVTRADHIVKGLNQFSHTIDEAVKEVDAVAAMSLVISLANRFIAMKNIKVDFKAPDKAISLVTNPFYLNNLLWFCLEYAMEFPAEDKTITVQLESVENRLRFIFNGLSGLSEAKTEKKLFAAQGKVVSDYLCAEIDIDATAGCFAASLPYRLA